MTSPEFGVPSPDRPELTPEAIFRDMVLNAHIRLQDAVDRQNRSSDAVWCRSTPLVGEYFDDSSAAEADINNPAPGVIWYRLGALQDLAAEQEKFDVGIYVQDRESAMPIPSTMTLAVPSLIIRKEEKGKVSQLAVNRGNAERVSGINPRKPFHKPSLVEDLSLKLVTYYSHPMWVRSRA